MPTSRRAFLRGTLNTGLSLARGQGRPNIIVILTDDQRHDAMSCARPSGPLIILKTPQMDRLAREGVRFRNAFVTTSLCSASRASILSGKHVHSHGVRTLQGDLPETCAIFP